MKTRKRKDKRMKRTSIFLLLISFLLFAKPLAAAEEQREETSLESLAHQLKRSAERSKEFALSKDTGNLLLFALSAGFLIYLPKHLSKSDVAYGIVDDIIAWPRFSRNSSTWAYHFYYELLTLLAGYICLKTAGPVLEKFKK